MRRRRVITSQRPYEICMRVKKGLPFTVHNLIKLLLLSAMARTQRDKKVTLCHHLWMGNHPHIIAIAHDAKQCENFYQEVQKKITESIKRLIGAEHLSLWEGRPMVAEVHDLDMMKRRLAYIYLNPVRANLTESVDQYPGLSSWNSYSAGKDTYSEQIPWVQMNTIRELPLNRITESLDEFMVKELRCAAKRSHEYKLEHNAWMKCYGITTKSEMDLINQSIFQNIREKEEELKAARIKDRKTVLGVKRLKEQSFSWDYVPRKRSRKIFVLASDRGARIRYIQGINEICKKCRELYQLALKGVTNLEWPPGVFRPPLPPLANAVSVFT